MSKSPKKPKKDGAAPEVVTNGKGAHPPPEADEGEKNEEVEPPVKRVEEKITAIRVFGCKRNPEVNGVYSRTGDTNEHFELKAATGMKYSIHKRPPFRNRGSTWVLEDQFTRFFRTASVVEADQPLDPSLIWLVTGEEAKNTANTKETPRLIDMKADPPFKMEKVDLPEAGFWAVRGVNHERTGRHLILEDFGPEGQAKVSASSVLVVGCGGLGAVCLYLAGAGVGRLGIADHDVVDFSNLHRQVLYKESDVGRKKVDAAKERLLELNSSLTIETHPEGMTLENGVELASRYDLVLDCTGPVKSNRAASRYLVNDACGLANRPLLAASCVKFQGQLALWADGGPCLRCVYPNPLPPDKVAVCSDAGVLGPVPGMMGSMLAIEALKYLAGKCTLIAKREMVLIDALRLDFQKVAMPNRPRRSCALCGEEPTLNSLDAKNYPPATCPLPKLKQKSWNVTWDDYLKKNEEHVLLDVRPAVQARVAAPIGVTRVLPLPELLKDKDAFKDCELPIYVVCRRGKASVEATNELRRRGLYAYNISGGVNQRIPY